MLCTGDEAARVVQQWTDSAMVFGVNCSYDTVGLDALLERAGLTSTWFYAPQSIDAIAYGFVLKDDPAAPRSSEPLSKACGVDVPGPRNATPRWATRCGCGAGMTTCTHANVQSWHECTADLPPAGMR